MYELALPSGFTLLPTPLPAEHSHAGLRRGILFWVLAGHGAAVWLVVSWAATLPQSMPVTEAPRVLRVNWVESESVQEPPVVEAVRPAPPPSAMPPPPPIPAPAAVPRPEPIPAPAPQPATVPEPSQPAETLLAVPEAAPSAIQPAPAPQTVAKPEWVAPPVVAAMRPPPPARPLIPPSFHADYLSNPAPAYPPLSRRLGEEGTVRLRVQVSAEGLPLSVGIEAGSGHPRLDEAARQAVAAWRFVPARRGERNVAGWVMVPVNFSLRR